MDSIQKLAIVNSARNKGLWDVGCEFKEEQRSVLRLLGVARKEAVCRAWERLRTMIDLASSSSNPFDILDIGFGWTGFVSDYEARRGELDRQTAWGFIHFLDDEVVPPNKFSEELVQFGRRDPGWFMIEGYRHFRESNTDVTPLPLAASH